MNVLWFGGWYNGTPNNGTFYAPAAMLAPYWGTAKVGGCPTFSDTHDLLRPGYGPVDYAYNSVAARQVEWSGTASVPQDRSGLGVVLSSIRNSSEKAAVWDSARVINGGLDRTPFGYPSSGNPFTGSPEPTFHARRANRRGL